MKTDFIDIHTHNQEAPAGQAVINLPDSIFINKVYPFRENCFYSVGIHPMYPGDWTEAYQTVEALARRDDVVAVGECGLDKLSPVSLEIQSEYFVKHLLLADGLERPVIIHCVRAWDELLHIHKQHPSSQPRIVHGFRGKPQLAEQLLRAGFHLSFGPRFHADSLRLCPADRRHAETDDSSLTIEAVLQSHSAALKRMQS